MNTLWLKIASGAIGILIIIVLVSMFMPGGDKESATQPVSDGNNLPSNFWEQVENDKEELSIPEDYANYSEEDSLSANKPSVSNDIASPPIPQEAQPVPAQPQPTETTIYVKKPNDAEEVEAEKQYNYALNSFSIGRLPTTSFKPSIDAARRIIDRWPDSIYAFQSKLLLAKVPERFQQQYKITSEEIDTSIFFQPRAGTRPVIITIEEQ
ncbi:MAG: hypothetical protein JXA96_03475 [Sedimentisphaerales bacterium]|nr:hypothetical protein [Sedimentisphaerales bacterium]